MERMVAFGLCVSLDTLIQNADTADAGEGGGDLLKSVYHDVL